MLKYGRIKAIGARALGSLPSLPSDRRPPTTALSPPLLWLCSIQRRILHNWSTHHGRRSLYARTPPRAQATAVLHCNCSQRLEL
jgi:hypothetical protein